MVASLWEVKRWLYGWAEHAVVLAPSQLVNDMQNAIAAVRNTNEVDVCIRSTAATRRKMVPERQN
jgi:hypothetical protein